MRGKDPSLYLFEEQATDIAAARPPVIALCQQCEDGTYRLIRRFEGLGEHIIEKVDEIIWWAVHGGLQEHLDTANDALEYAKERDVEGNIAARYAYFLDFLAETKHFHVQGLKSDAAAPRLVTPGGAPAGTAGAA